MVYVSKKSEALQLAAGLVPFIFSILFALTCSWIPVLLCAASLFAVVGLLPLFRYRESLYMFVFVAISGFPTNLKLSLLLVTDGILDSGFLIDNILWGIMLCFVFFSAEEIAFGVVTRLLWKKQYRIKI